MGGVKFKSDVAKNSGSNPIWNNEFVFKNVLLENSVMRFDVWDKNKLIDTALGTVEYALSNLLACNGKFNGGLQLLHKGVNSGTLFLDI
jgi:Ca2+-dependent lipid-binding protein